MCGISWLAAAPRSSFTLPREIHGQASLQNASLMLVGLSANGTRLCLGEQEDEKPLWKFLEGKKSWKLKVM